MLFIWERKQICWNFQKYYIRHIASYKEVVFIISIIFFQLQHSFLFYATLMFCRNSIQVMMQFNRNLCINHITITDFL